jgi:hypothetical protein
MNRIQKATMGSRGMSCSGYLLPLCLPETQPAVGNVKREWRLDGVTDPNSVAKYAVLAPYCAQILGFCNGSLISRHFTGEPQTSEF